MLRLGQRIPSCTCVVSNRRHHSLVQVHILVQSNPKPGKEVGECPDTDDRSTKRPVANPLSIDSRDEGMNSNGQDKEPAAHIARVQQPSLRKAWSRGSQDRVESNPVPADQERRALLQIGDQQVQHEKDVLVVAKKGPVMQLPRY